MSKFINALISPIGRKLLTGLTGIALCMFIVVHLLGNLQLFIGAEQFNYYTHKLESLAPLIYLVELALVGLFVLHAIVGIAVQYKKFTSRPVGYNVYNSAGGVSKQTFSSRTMIITGPLLLVFVIFHVITLKYGAYYATSLDGAEVRDLHKLVIENFQNPAIVFGYEVIMILLGYHLRHGAWSALQSLGLMNKTLTPLIYTLGAIFAILISAGFLVLPVWVFFTGGV